MTPTSISLDLAGAKTKLSKCPIGHTIHYYPSVTSTMPLAHELCKLGTPSGALIITDQQTQGRGRLNRRWETPFGQALLASIILDATLLQVPATHLSILAALAVRRAVVDTDGKLAQKIAFKWPNDVLGIVDLADNQTPRKLAGILTETVFEGSQLRYAILGIGINVNQAADAFPDDAQAKVQPTSLRLLAAQQYDRTALLINLCYAISDLCKEKDNSLLQEWGNHLYTLGRRVTVTETAFQRPDHGSRSCPSDVPSNHSFIGTAVDITHEGHLVVENAKGERRTFSSGEVTLRSGPNVLDDV